MTWWLWMLLGAAGLLALQFVIVGLSRWLQRVMVQDQVALSLQRLAPRGDDFRGGA